MSNGQTTEGTFLDHAPVDWTRPEIRALQDVLVAAYDEKDTARALAYSAGLPVGTFPEAATMRLRWGKLIDALASATKLRRAVELASTDDTLLVYRARLLEFLGPSPALARRTEVSVVHDWHGASLTRAQFDQRLLEKRARFLPLATLERLVEISRSVAKLTFVAGGKRYHGTGLLIADRHVLTNHHNTLGETGAPLESMTVDFNAGSGAPDTQYQWDGKPPKGEAEQDWAVIELTKDVVGRKPVTIGTSFAITVGDALYIVGHPNAIAKQFSMAWHAVQHVGLDRVQYLVDTQTGSSGSPVFNHQMDVVALHHAEVLVESLWRNLGVEMSRIIKGLEQAGVPFTKKGG